MLNSKGIYAISDCTNTPEPALLIKTELILKSGIALFQYRNKTPDQTKKRELATKLQSLCRRYKTPFIVNDDLLLAKDIAADGIHLGKNDPDISIARKELGTKIIGLSCYNDINLAKTGAQQGADYIAFGAFFSSMTKPDAPRANIDLIRKTKSLFSIPVVAIGGITPENGSQLISAGVDYLAIIHGLYATPDTVKATQAYNHLFN